jgi:hypothetical protein
MSQNTPITDSAYANNPVLDTSTYRKAVRMEDMEALELAANAMEEALSQAEWQIYSHAETGPWQSCDACCNDRSEGHAPDCPKAAALAAYRALKPKGQ